jgi:hypothetical protein
MPPSPLELRMIWLRLVTRAVFSITRLSPLLLLLAAAAEADALFRCGWRRVGSKLGPTRAQHYAHGHFNCFSASDSKRDHPLKANSQHPLHVDTQLLT